MSLQSPTSAIPQYAHREPPPDGIRNLSNYLLSRAVFLSIGFPKNAFGSVDLTNRCNLRCKHCYFFEQEVPEEFSDEEWLAKFKEMGTSWNKTRSVTWIGGEPLLRKELIEQGKKYFAHNLIVTNGLITLPDWKDVHFHISIDGDEEAHEKMRNQKGIYQKIKKHADRPDLNVVLAYTITSLNVDVIEKVLEEWHPVGIKGILFSFYTPIESIADPLFPGWDKRDAALDMLIRLKESKYGNYIQNETRVLELMKQENAKQVTDTCLFKSKGFALDPVGKKKPKCMLGDKADCEKCGCIVPYYLHWRMEKKKIIKDTIHDLSHYFSSRIRHLFASTQQENNPGDHVTQ